MTTKGFWGGLLIVVGCLIAVLSGGCTIFMFSIFQKGMPIFFTLLIGGVPFLVGLGLFALGRKIRGDDADKMKDRF